MRPLEPRPPPDEPKRPPNPFLAVLKRLPTTPFGGAEAFAFILTDAFAVFAALAEAFGGIGGAAVAFGGIAGAAVAFGGIADILTYPNILLYYPDMA